MGQLAGSDTECFVIASGPSLTKEDCERVREYGAMTIVVNNTYQLAPWADYLYAMDDHWWNEMGNEAREVFSGRLIGPRKASYSTSFPVQRVEHVEAGSSGAAAVAYAATRADKVYLLGFDCEEKDGKRRWHGEHRKSFPKNKMPDFQKHLKRVIEQTGCRAYNMTRGGAVGFLPRIALEALSS